MLQARFGGGRITELTTERPRSGHGAGLRGLGPCARLLRMYFAPGDPFGQLPGHETCELALSCRRPRPRPRSDPEMPSAPRTVWWALTRSRTTSPESGAFIWTRRETSRSEKGGSVETQIEQLQRKEAETPAPARCRAAPAFFTGQRASRENPQRLR